MSAQRFSNCTTTYVGVRISYAQVCVDEGGFQDWLLNEGDHGFLLDWGSNLAGSKDLAWSILAHHLNDHRFGNPTGEAERLHLRFCDDVISKLPAEGFRLSAAEVAAWLEKQAVCTA